MKRKIDPWIRCRFKANADDYRPIKWPPPGPYWCSGFGDGYNIVIAYVRNIKQVHEYWPEAEDVDPSACNGITYSDRFPKPDWYEVTNDKG